MGAGSWKKTRTLKSVYNRYCLSFKKWEKLKFHLFIRMESVERSNLHLRNQVCMYFFLGGGLKDFFLIFKFCYFKPILPVLVNLWPEKRMDWIQRKVIQYVPQKGVQSGDCDTIYTIPFYTISLSEALLRHHCSYMVIQS